MARKPATSRAEIEALVNKGFNQTEIAKILGISKQGVSYHRRHTEGEAPETPVERRKKSLPWDVEGEQARAAQYRYLLRHLEYADTKGKGMTADTLSKLRAFYEKLTNFEMVVRYDPHIPPRPGQRFGGFEYTPRTESDGNLILRIDDHTEVPADSREIWQIPAREDWPE